MKKLIGMVVCFGLALTVLGCNQPASSTKDKGTGGTKVNVETKDKGDVKVEVKDKGGDKK